MPDIMSHRESPRSRSRSLSRSPVKQYRSSPINGRRSPDKRIRSRSKYSRDRERSYRPRSRSPSMKTDRMRSVSRSRSFSRSYSNDRRRSPSPSHSRGGRSVANTREKPQQSRCLGIFGLSIYTDESKIRSIFSKFGHIERVQLVIDAKTGKSRGFCFVYYDNMADAKAAKDAISGMEIDERRIRVDYSITQRPHTPTPGCYMGRPTRKYREREYHDRYRDEYRRRRSPSPYRERRRRYDRSRSRSYTPRRYRY